MTECNSISTGTECPKLTRLRRQVVKVDFNGGTLTSDSGLLLLREVDRRVNLISRIDKLIPDPRDLRYATHSQAEMLTSRIFAIAAGYEDVNDFQQLRHDAAFQLAAGRTPACARLPNSWLKKFDRYGPTRKSSSAPIARLPMID